MNYRVLYNPKVSRVCLDASASGFPPVRTWKILSYTVALPGVAVCMINAYMKFQEHHAHHVTPEFVPYAHLRLRSKVRSDVSCCASRFGQYGVRMRRDTNSNRTPCSSS